MTLTRRSVLSGLGALSARSILPAWAQSLRITRGVAIPRWFDQPDGHAGPPSERVLEFLRNQGFESVRLQIDPDRLVIGGPVMQAALADLTRALSELSNIGFSVIVDMHPQGRIGAALEPPDAKELVQAWATIAARVADTSPDTVFLELLNEPPMERAPWIALRDQLAETVRRTCPYHTIIWGANRYQLIGETIDCPPLQDANSVVAVHYYAPLAFTHQCQSWGASLRSDLRYLPFPADLSSPEVVTALSELDSASAAYLRNELGEGWSIERVDADFDQLAAWSVASSTPVILSEFGALSHCTETSSRARWTGAVRKAAERHGIGWIYWEFDQGFGFIESRSELGDVDVEVLDALVGR